MKPIDSAWPRLASAARRAGSDRGEGEVPSAPPGFATRVVALAFEARRPLAPFFERLSWRALGVACLLALLSLAVNYSVLTATGSPDDAAALDDGTVAALLGLSST
jgi:hypothetical protein